MQIQTAASIQRSDDTPASQGTVPVKPNLPATTQSKSAGPQQAKKSAQIAQARFPKGNKQLSPTRTDGGQSTTRQRQYTTDKGQLASAKGQQASVKGKQALASGPSGSTKGQQALIDERAVLPKDSTKGGTIAAQRMPAPGTGQPQKAEKKQKTGAATETDSLSTADMAQLMALVQEASQCNPDPVMPLTSKSIHPVANAAAAATAAAAVAKRNPKAAGSKQPSKGTTSSQAAALASAPAPAAAAAANTISQSGGSQDCHISKSSQSKAKKQNHSTDARSAAAGVSHLLPAAATVSQLAVVSNAGPAAAADDPDESAAAAGLAGSAPGGKQKKKMGRKARLRLKRQAFRQQQQGTGADDAPDGVSIDDAAQSGKVAVAKRATAARRATLEAAKGTAEPVNGQLAPLDGQKPVLKGQTVPLNGHSEPASAAGAPEQLLPGSASNAKKSKKKGKQHLLAQTPGEQLPAGSSDASKKKSKSLLEQMRSKLSGGRFRMLNEQLYTSEGEDAFSMMQGQPDLFQQYHEVRMSSDHD